jgi:translation initiation factor 3 subunit
MQINWSSEAPRVVFYSFNATYLYIIFPFSDEEDKKRVVRSARDKRWEELQAIIRELTQHTRINDWNAVVSGTLL